jgi:3-phosphoshikimate 1-carboxyvinyltransferase
VHIPRRVTIQPVQRVRGTIRVPGDKSISHRYGLLAALADGRTVISNYAPGGDCQSTLDCLATLGVAIEREAADAPGDPPRIVVHGRGIRGLTAAATALDCGNSGSTMRMLAGVVAAHPFTSTLSGDRSLTRRPMRRVVTPLSLMGARFEAAEGDRPPLTVHGADLRGIDFVPDVPSAQVKSAVLLAGLQASGTTTVAEETLTRDHTERALLAFGVTVVGGTFANYGPGTGAVPVSVAGGQRLRPLVARVPGDISSAAFAAVAAGALSGSDVTIHDVGLNMSRIALFDVLMRFGVRVEITPTGDWQGERVGQVRVHSLGDGHSKVELGPEIVPLIIDELPALAVLATAGGELRVTGASELRVKESDRITALVTGLRALGADADELPDGFHIRSRGKLSGGLVHAHSDHRLAMAFAVAGLTAAGPVTIDGADAAAVSYPTFFADLDRLRA